ncbi:MAG: hypothetical protein V1644_01635 [Candidatus Micrarchaeota archaeon]
MKFQAPKRIIRVLDLACGPMLLTPLLEKRYKKMQVDYHGIDLESESLPELNPTQTITPHFYRKPLAFTNPTKLRTQLTELFGATRFHEIHFHMPYNQPEASPSAQNALKVIADFLEDGGHFYHVLQEASALAPTIGRNTTLDEELDNNYGAAYRKRRKILQEAATAAGLKLKQYGFRGDSIHSYDWLTETRQSPDENWDAAEAKHEWIKQHTREKGLANQFIVMQKPKQSKRKIL